MEEKSARGRGNLSPEFADEGEERRMRSRVGGAAVEDGSVRADVHRSSGAGLAGDGAGRAGEWGGLGVPDVGLAVVHL